MSGSSDTNLIRQTKVRLQNLRRKGNLQQLATRCVANNIGLYAKSDDENQLSSLPEQVREMVLQELLRREDLKLGTDSEARRGKVVNAIPFLLSPRTNKLDTTNVRVGLKLLQSIAQHAPNVEELVAEFCAEKADVLKVLKEMKQLRILIAVDLVLNFRDLADLCQSLPKLCFLQVDHVVMDHQRVSPEEAAVCLANLGLLRCRVVDNTTTVFVEHYLPNLDFAFEDEDVSNPDFYNMTNFFDRASNVSKNYLQISWCVTDSEPVERIHLKHPDVTHLRIKCTGFAYANNWQQPNQLYLPRSMLRFSKVETLELHWLPARRALHQALNAYGHNLRALAIVGCFGTLSKLKLDSLFAKCPRLEKLHLEYVAVSGEIIAKGTCSALKQLTWIEPYKKFYPNALSQVCSAAENLEKMVIEGEDFSVADLDAVSKMITEQQVLRKLKSLHISMTDCDDEGSFEYEEDSHTFEGVAYMLKMAAAFLPELTDVQFFVNGGDCEYYSSNVNYSIAERLQDELSEMYLCDSGMTDSMLFRLYNIAQAKKLDEELVAILGEFHKHNGAVPEEEQANA